MLAEIHARKFVLFDEINIEFSKGMNVVTGETGAGKSLFLSMLKVLFGEKPQLAKNRSEVEARFISSSGEETIVGVKISSSRISARLNGSIVSISQLRNVVDSFMAIHTQGAFGILRDPKTHTSFVDLFDSELPGKIERYQNLFHEYMQIKHFLDSGGAHLDVEEEIRELEGESKKIEQIIVDDEEYNRMLSNYKRLSNAKEIVKTIQEVSYMLNEENGLEEISQALLRKLKELRALDDTSNEFLNVMEEIEEGIEELSRDIERYGNTQDLDEEKLMELEDRISDVERLKRKYGPTLRDVQERTKEIQERIDELRKKSGSFKKAKKHLEELNDKMKPLANEMKIKRAKSARELLKKTENNLHDLGMKETKLNFMQHETDFMKSGIDWIEFVGRVNPGSDEIPISKIASGGEMSRFYLAIEAALGKSLPVETVVFDEVGSGVGVRTADVVAKKLKDISKHTQLIVITHMPQIAAMADKHFKVEKKVMQEKTSSFLIELASEERKTEIKEMFGKMPEGV